MFAVSAKEESPHAAQKQGGWPTLLFLLYFFARMSMRGYHFYNSSESDKTGGAPSLRFLQGWGFWFFRCPKD